MEKIQVPAHSEASIEEVFNNLQEYIKTNIDRRLSLLFKNLGIKKLSSETAFKLAITSGATFTVQPGTAITASYEYININEVLTTDLLSIITPLTINQHYLIKLKWVSVGSKPIAVMNGFNYNSLSTIDTRFTKYSDSWEFVVETISSGTVPTANADEILLGIVKATTTSTLNSGVWTFDSYTSVAGIVDLRDNTVLELDNIALADTSKLVLAELNHKTNSLNIKPSLVNGIITFSDKDSTPIIYVDEVNKKVGINKTTDPSSADLDILGDVKINGEFTSTGSINTSGDINATGAIYSNGRLVITEENLNVPDIVNFRITNIAKTDEVKIDSSVTSSKVTKEVGSHNRNYLNVSFKWGYSNIIGTGGIGTFTITSGESFAVNALVDLWLWHPGKQDSYKIVSNTSTVLTLQDSNSAVPNLTGFNLTSLNYGSIHHNVMSYELTLIPMVGDELHPIMSITKIINVGIGVVAQGNTVKLPAGRKYLAKVRGLRGLYIGDWADLPSGSYIKYDPNTPVPYGIGGGAFIVKHADLINTGSSIAALATENGFNISLTIGAGVGYWSEAEEFEIAWSTIQGNIDFDRIDNYQSVILSRYKKSYDITTSASRNYSIAVRALIGGIEVVSEQLNTSVTSGSAGTPPMSSSLMTFPVKKITYSGNITLASGGAATLTSVVTHAGGTTNVTNFPEDIVGSILTFKGNDYLISYKAANLTIILSKLVDGLAVPASGTGTFTINTSKRGRRLTTTLLPADVRLTRLEFDCDIFDGIFGTASNLRVYQLSRETLNDSMSIGASDSLFTAVAGHIISNTYGERRVIVDLWDETETINNASVTGRLTIYGIPYYSNPKK